MYIKQRFALYLKEHYNMIQFLISNHIPVLRTRKEGRRDSTVLGRVPYSRNYSYMWILVY